MEAEQWGIALLSVQANLPSTLPGQNALFMLMGDAQMENAVVSADLGSPKRDFTAVDIEDAHPVTAAADAVIRFYPLEDSAQVRTLEADTLVMVDALSEDGAWARVSYEAEDDTFAGWVLADQLVDLQRDQLDMIDYQASMPMQAFYLRTAVGRLECAEAPNSLVVQSPENLQIQISANGAEIRLGATVMLREIPVEPAIVANLEADYTFDESIDALMELTVMDGVAYTSPDTDEEQVIPAGYVSYTCLAAVDDLGAERDADDRRIIDGCGWTQPIAITRGGLDSVTPLDGVTLNYAVDLSTPEPQVNVIQPVAPVVIEPTATLWVEQAAPPVVEQPAGEQIVDTQIPPTLVPPTVVLPTSTLIPPTNTPIPPTSTLIPPTLTRTPVSPSNTPIAPTRTPTSIPPTNTQVPPSNTPIPPTNTSIPPTPIPPTSTPIPPTAVPPTNTPPWMWTPPPWTPPPWWGGCDDDDGFGVMPNHGDCCDDDDDDSVISLRDDDCDD